MSVGETGNGGGSQELVFTAQLWKWKLAARCSSVNVVRNVSTRPTQKSSGRHSVAIIWEESNMSVSALDTPSIMSEIKETSGLNI